VDLRAIKAAGPKMGILVRLRRSPSLSEENEREINDQCCSPIQINASILIQKSVACV
jgi:hypothetical protein